MIAWSWNNPIDSIIRLLQKVFRGYSDADLWNLNVTISHYILPRLRRYKNMPRIGIPTMVFDKEDERGCDDPKKDLYYERKWEMILDKMITAFGLILREDYPHSNNVDECGLQNWIKADEIRREKIKEGLELFAKYFGCLWD